MSATEQQDRAGTEPRNLLWWTGYVPGWAWGLLSTFLGGVAVFLGTTALWYHGLSNDVTALNTKMAAVESAQKQQNDRLDSLIAVVHRIDGRLASAELAAKFKAAVVTSDAKTLETLPQVTINIFNIENSTIKQFNVVVDGQPDPQFVKEMSDAVREVSATAKDFTELAESHGPPPPKVWAKCSFLVADPKKDVGNALLTALKHRLIQPPTVSTVPSTKDFRTWPQLMDELRSHPTKYGLFGVAVKRREGP